jgi:hypothetical protein
MNKQRGVTTFGVVFLIAGIMAAAFLVMKLLPPYFEYFSVKKVISAMAKQEDLANMTPKEIQASFDRRATIDNITVVSGNDLQIGHGTVAAEYTVKVPLVANISFLLDFSASSGTDSK